METRILAISDSHRDPRVITDVIEKEFPFDILVHCGDMEGSLYPIEQRNYPFKIYAVLGNCDAGGYPAEISFKIGVYNIFVCHGHRYMVHNSLGPILQAGKASFADVILYGHTHIPEITTKNGILLVNPGSIAKPMQVSRLHSYAIVMISDDYLPEAEIRYLYGSDKICFSKTKGIDDRIIKEIMSEIDRSLTVQKISRIHNLPVDVVERICRMYLTHPRISVDGILNRIQ